MKRNPTRREIEMAIETLTRDRGGEDDELTVVITDSLVIPRSQAEDEEREILGPAETPTDEEHVRVRVPTRDRGRTIQLDLG